MKNIFFLSILMLSFCITNAQLTPESFKKMLPPLPSNICSLSIEERKAYMNKLDSISNEIAVESESGNVKSKGNEKQMQQQMRQQMMNNAAKQYGLSQEDMKKLMASQNMSKEEKDAMAKKIFQQQTNLSVDGLKKAQGYSKEGQKAYVEGVGTEMMADQASDPKKTKEKAVRDKANIDLSNKIQFLSDSLNAVFSGYGKKFQDLNAKMKMDGSYQEMLRLEKECNDMYASGSYDGKTLKSVKNKIITIKKEICSKYTPANLQIVREYIASAEFSLPAWERLEKMQAESGKLQYGVDYSKQTRNPWQQSLVGIVNIMKRAFDYNLLGSSDLLIGM
jgi:hypothetical protein